MKIVILFLFIFLGCKSPQPNKEKPSINTYRVVKLDSINDVYIIYAKTQNMYYKILSAKDSEVKGMQCDKILVNNSYRFQLNSLLASNEIDLLHVDGIKFNNETIEIEKDSIMDLHTSSNLKGLCYSNTD